MSDSSYPSDRQDKFMLRLPDGMRDRIKAAAETNNRSMNAEIVATLEEQYPDGPADLEVAMQQTLKDGQTRRALFGGSYVIISASGRGGVLIKSEDGRPLGSPPSQTAPLR